MAYKYSLGGGYKVSDGWEPLGPAGFYDTFGPELSFGAALRAGGIENFAIAKFTHSGSQIIDWTPEGSEAQSRNLYPAFLTFVRDAIQELEAQGPRRRTGRHLLSPRRKRYVLGPVPPGRA